MGLRVLFLSSWGRACGIATYSLNLIDQLEAQGVSVEVYSDLKNFNGLAKLAKESNADVVHIQHEFGISMPPEPLLSAIAKFRKAGKIVVMTLHTEDKGFNILLDGALDAVIVHADKFDMASKNTFSPFYKIPHGIPEITFPEDKKFYRQKYNIPEDALVIGTCGFVSKSRAEMLESFVLAIAPGMKQRNMFLHFVTSAHANDPGGTFAKSIQASVMNIATQHGVADRVIMTADFMDTQEFRERIYTLDFGIAYADLGVASNSGAAADILSCGVPTVINASPHFSHVAPYCLTAGDTLSDIVNVIKTLPEQDVQGRTGPARAIQDIGYSVIAKRHIELYNNALFVKNAPATITKKVVSSNKPVTTEQPIVLTMPNSMWQVLYIWTRLQGLVDQGHTIKFMLQADGVTDVNLLRWCLPGIAGITFTDVGMVRDPRLVRVHSRCLAQNMTTDVEAWVRSNQELAALFSFLPVNNYYALKLGEYAETTASKLVENPTTLDAKVFVVPIPGQNAILADVCRAHPVNVLCTPTRYTPEVDALVDMITYTQKGRTPTLVVEDIRTNLACALLPNMFFTGWNELALMRLLRNLPTTIYCVSDLEYKLAYGLAGNMVNVVRIGA